MKSLKSFNSWPKSKNRSLLSKEKPSRMFSRLPGKPKVSRTKLSPKKTRSLKKRQYLKLKNKENLSKRFSISKTFLSSLGER
jgi:hypothetical protein